MTDYFALLEQPRRPWLEPEQLKQAFHAKALQEHPDAQLHEVDAGASGTAFAELNEAYQVLHDPKRRLHHLLSLCDHAPDRRPNAIPAELGELFPAVASVTQSASALVQQSANATTALSRSLLKPQLVDVAERLNNSLQQLSAIQHNASTRLEELDHIWRDDAADHFAELEALYLKFSYLSRWIAELEEKRMQLLVL